MASYALRTVGQQAVKKLHSDSEIVWYLCVCAAAIARDCDARDFLIFPPTMYAQCTGGRCVIFSYTTQAATVCCTRNAKSNIVHFGECYENSPAATLTAVVDPAHAYSYMNNVKKTHKMAF